MDTGRHRLTRSRDHWIGGVCGGIAEYVGWPPLAVRMIFVLVSVVSAVFPGILVYVVLWALMPAPPAATFGDVA